MTRAATWQDPLVMRALDRAAARALGHQDRNPYSRTHGCFDRRFWAWKICDFPEATYQRLVLLLAGVWAEPASRFHRDPRLVRAVDAGLRFAASIQHRDGSFDQAFVHEHSYGATGFLLHSLVAAARRLGRALPPETGELLAHMARRGAEFLAGHREEHGLISNHLAGAALSLLDCAALLDEERYLRAAEDLLAGVLAGQSPEGWLPEYQGADPGYQTLCVHYLAQVQALLRRDDLGDALKNSAEFLAHFAHPDGSFGGEYGSRRTAVFYPGGLAAMGRQSAEAAALAGFMAGPVLRGDSIGLDQIDLGNLAPLAESHLLAWRSPPSPQPPGDLPWQRPDLQRYFPAAGLQVAATGRLFVVVGASNGGVVKVFDKAAHCLLHDDCGYVGRTRAGRLLTTQITVADPLVRQGENSLELEAQFQRWLQPLPGPWRFVALRLLNLSVMRWLPLGHIIKRMLVRAMITGQRPSGLRLLRRIQWSEAEVSIADELSGKARGGGLVSLEAGRGFTGIHMASAGYFQASEMREAGSVAAPDLAELAAKGVTRLRTCIRAGGDGPDSEAS